MAERPLYTLYKNLKAQNFDVPEDYDRFESALTRDGKSGADNRHAMYENLKAQNYDVPDTYERFYSALFHPVSKDSSRANGGSVPMSDAEKARFAATASAIVDSGRQTVKNAGNYVKAKQRQQKKQKAFGRVDLGVHKTIYGGDADNVVEDETQYNPETGKMGVYMTSDNHTTGSRSEAEERQAILDIQNDAYQEGVDTGEIPSIFDVRDKQGNYDLQENIGKNGTYLTEEGARKQLDRKLEAAYAQRKKIEEAIAEDNSKNGNPLLSYTASYGGGNGSSDYRRKLQTSLSLVNEQIGALEAVKQYPTSSWGEDAWKALDNTAFTAKTWDFGVTDFATMGQMERIKTKMDNNIPLDDADKMLLRSKLGADAAAALEDEKMGNIYRWTKIAGYSLPFMADFFLTGGYGGITQAASRGAIKFAAKRGMSKVGAAILKNTGIVAADVLGSYAMAATEQGMKTGADIMDRHLGELYQDENGEYRFGTFDDNGNLLHEGGESIGTALYKGLTSAMVENYTEKLFGHNYGIKKGVIAAMEKHGMSRTAAFLKGIGQKGWYRNSKEWMGKFGINGFGEEVMEEEIAIPLHALLDGDNKFSDLGNMRQQLDIIGGMAISVGSMYAASAATRPIKAVYDRAQYYRFKHKVSVADIDARRLMGDSWEQLKEQIDGTTNEQMGGVLAGVFGRRSSMSKEQIDATVMYAVNLMKMRGYNIAKTAEVEARQTTGEQNTPEEQHQEDIENAYAEGHETEGEETHTVQLEHNDSAKTLAGLLGVTEEQLHDMSDDELEAMTGQNDKLDAAIYEYQKSTAKYQGVMDSANEKVDMAAHEAALLVDQQTDLSRGTVRNATIKATNGEEDYGVYIISGNIATHDDGTIDISGSDKMILYYDPRTGRKEYADPARFAALGEEVPADEVKEQAVRDAKERTIREVAGIIDGKVGEGSQFTVTDADGTQHTYEILAENGDGTAMVTIDGNVEQNPYALQDLQALKDAEDQKTLAAARAEREKYEQEQEAKVKASSEWLNNVAASIMNDDGKIVVVAVEGEENKNTFVTGEYNNKKSGKKRYKIVTLNEDGTVSKARLVAEDKVQVMGTYTAEDFMPTLKALVGASEAETSEAEVNGGEQTVDADETENMDDADETDMLDDAASSMGLNNTEETTAPAEEEVPAITLEDGTVVPMLEDGNPDLTKMTAAQIAELYDSQFDEDADGLISSMVKDTKAALDKANGMTIKGKNFAEQKASKDAKEKAIAEAQAAYDNAKAVQEAYKARTAAREESTAEGRRMLIEKARRKFNRLKSAVKDDVQAVRKLYDETVGELLHRLYDSTGVDVFDDVPQTVDEYVASSVAPYSLSYEDEENGKGVKQETGLSRADFAKRGWLAAEGKGVTIDALVHKLWGNRPGNLQSADTQDIRNALLGLITSDETAFGARNYIQDNRIAQAENVLEEERLKEEDAKREAELKKKAEEEAKRKAELKKAEEQDTHSEAFNKIVELAKKQKEYWDMLEKDDVNPDEVETVDVAGEMDELLKTLSDEEFKEVSDVLEDIDEEFEYFTADEHERREDVAERKRSVSYKKTQTEILRQMLPYVDAIKAAVESGDKKALEKAQKELKEALLNSNLGHGWLSSVLAQYKIVKKTDELYKAKRACIKPLTDAINAIESALDSAMNAAGLDGVHVNFNENGEGWISAEKGSSWKSRIEALDNNYRNVSQYDGVNPVSDMPPITLRNTDEVARLIKSQIEEGERYNAEESADEEEEGGFPGKLREPGEEGLQLPDDATEDNPLGGEEEVGDDVPFSAKNNGELETQAERAANIELNRVDNIDVVDAIIGKKTRKALARIAKMMGAKIQYQYSDRLANGWFDSKTNTIYLTLDSSITEGVQFIFGHEMTHEIKTKNAEAYEELKKVVKETVGEDDFEALVDNTAQRYMQANVLYWDNREEIEEEVVADQLGYWMRDLNYAQTLAMKMSHPLLAKIHEIINRIRMAFHDTEYTEAAKNIMRSIEQAYVATANREAENTAVREGEGGQRMSLRTKEAPKNTLKVYKLMRLNPAEEGKLFPLFIGNVESVELGKWYDAESPKLQDLKSLSSRDYVGTRTVEVDGEKVKETYNYGSYIVNNETGEAMSLADFKKKHKGEKEFSRMGKNPNAAALNWATDNGYRWIKIEEKKKGQGRYGGENRSYYNYGINGAGSVATFAMRPGWHAGSLPTMRQIGKGSGRNLRDDNFVWVEGEIPADIDYNEEAKQNADEDIPDHIPTDGFYLKATNANKEASQADKVGWYVAGAFKANRIMGDKETRDVIDKWNAEHPGEEKVEYDWKRESGKDFNAETMSLEDTPKFSIRVYHGSGADFSEFDFDHMGEGAGSQVFGWGGYVTSSEKIGKSYANLNRSEAFPDDIFDTENKKSVARQVQRSIVQGYDENEAIQRIRNSINSTLDYLKENEPNNHEAISIYEEKESILNDIESGKLPLPKMSLYEVNIPDNTGSNYLEWAKKPSDEVATKILEGLYSLDAETLDKMAARDMVFRSLLYDYIKNADKEQMIPLLVKTHALTRGTVYDNRTIEDTIQTVYNRLTNWMGSPKAASQFLSSIGFTGITYPAGTRMGGAEEGDTNYVIFKPEDMKIAEHTKFSIKTWHGSQADFDHFDHSFMGSGEGAQAYGWGTYVSEVEGIAKAYAKQNTLKRKNEYAKAEYKYREAEGIYRSEQDRLDKDREYLQNILLPNLERYQKALDRIKSKKRQTMAGEYEKDIKRVEASIDRAKKVIENDEERVKDAKEKMEAAEAALNNIQKVDRNLYTVEIPDDTGDNYLDWDKTVGTENAKRIGKALESEGWKLEEEGPHGSMVYEKDGEEIDIFAKRYFVHQYTELSRGLESDKAASQLLSKAGFVGVKVIAQRNTGGNKEGKMNYVIFDEDNAKIVDHTKFSLKDDKTLAGVHNITEDKLRKALKLGGLANPSLAVIDTSKNGHSGFGEISFIAPSALVDRQTGKTAGTWTTDAYTQRYPAVERQITDKGYENFKKWVDGMEYSSADKSEIQRNAKDVLESGGTPAWELMYLKEKGIDVKAYDSDVDSRWQELIEKYPTAKAILDGMKNDPEMNDSVTKLVRSAIVMPVWENISNEVRWQMYEETGVKVSPVSPKVRKQVKEIFERDYAPQLLDKDGQPKKADVEKTVEDMVKQYDETKRYSFYKSKVKASTYVSRNGLYDDYVRWQENKLDEFGTKNRIFRGYKNDGTRKYVPETLENVSKAMREDANGQTNGGEYTSFGSFIAKLADRVDSTEEMRANKGKLSSKEDKEAFYKKWEDVYYDLAKSLYNDVAYGEERLHEIVLQSDPKKYAKKEYGITLTPTFMKKLDALKKAVREELKSGYFETKFDRPVRLNEFVAAVVPNDLGNDVRKGLESSGLSLYDYDPQVDGDRQRAFDEAVNSSDVIKFSLAGERGAANLDKADEVTTRIDNLNVARKMEEENKDAKAIKIATGWERGADGKWRYEIPDFQFNFDKWKESNKAAMEKMDDKDYRSLMRYTNEFYNDMSPVKKRNFDKLMDKYGYKVEENLTLADVLDGKGANEIFKAYPQLKDIKFAFDKNMRRGDLGAYLSDDNIIKINASFEFSPSSVRSLLLHEVQHAIQHIEGFAKGGNKFFVRDQIKERFNDVKNQIKRLRSEGKEDEAKALIAKNKGLYHAYANEKDDFKNYESLAGEVEARNVQNRMGIPSYERKSSLAAETEDVARKDQIFLGVEDGLSKYMENMPDGWKQANNNGEYSEESNDIRYSLRTDQYRHDLEQWKKDNGLAKDAQKPMIPIQKPGETVTDFMKRVAKYRSEMALWKTAPQYEGHLLSDDTAQGQFNMELQRRAVLKRIALQDSMLPIRKAQEAIMKEAGVDRLNIAEDAYTAENRSHGKGKNELEEYNDEFLQPLRKAYSKMMKNLGKSYDNVKVYMIAKHGLERNAQIAFKKALEKDFKDGGQRAAAYQAYKADVKRLTNDAEYESGQIDFGTWRNNDNAIRSKYAPSYMNYRYDKNGVVYDYSGLSALFDGTDFEDSAADLVKNVESKYGTDAQRLWNATNAATKKTLRDSYKAGMMTEEVYDFVRDMYKHYIPLRGWGETNADQVWNYMGGGKGVFNKVLKEANGRGSLADDPIAYIENMAQSGILLNNRNWVKQHLLLLAQNHPTSLLNVSKAWYVKTLDANGNEEWIPASPSITANMNAKQVKAALEAFELKMEAMEQTGDATQKREHLEISYPQTNSEEREHEVRVMKDGEEYVIYVNGAPQLAQAMNNSRAQRVRQGMESDKLDRTLAWIGRKMAAVYTSLSPLFIPSNFMRDTTMTLASTAIREDARYNYLLRKNMLTHWNTLPLVLRYQNGTLREKVRNGTATKTEENFYDFMMNGGETGFVGSLDVEDLKKKFKSELKDMNRMALNPKKAGHIIMDLIETLNRAIEDSNRFMVYLTSIQYGRSIGEAVNDAKDVTLNFNRKGTGEHGWQNIRNLYLFINPAIQSLQTLGALAKHHPFKFTAVTTAWLASGVLAPMVNAMLISMFGDDDDKDKYWSFSKWDRRNNLIMYVPTTKCFIKIPLAQEFRGFYGLGDMIASKMWGGEKAEESWEDYGMDLLGQVVDMLPLDPTGYDGNIAVSLMPNPIRPIFELAFNVDFTGKPLFKESEYNKYDPNFTKAYAGTPDWLVKISKMVNSIGNDYPDIQQNAIDRFGDPKFNLNNPAVVDHVLSSYLGGAYTMGSQVLGVLTKALNGEEVKTADIPLVSKFVSNPNDRPLSKKKGDEFWTTKERHDRAANTLSKLKKKAKADGDYSTLDVFFDSDEYKQYKIDDKEVKKYEEEKKKQKAEEEGEDYQPKKLTGDAVYEAHTTPEDDLEDLKVSQIFPKVNGVRKSWEGLVDMASSQAEPFYIANAVAIKAAEDVAKLREEISETKKGFIAGGKSAWTAKGMQKIRQLRKEAVGILEEANKEIIARQKAKAEKAKAEKEKK